MVACNLLITLLSLLFKVLNPSRNDANFPDEFSCLSLLECLGQSLVAIHCHAHLFLVELFSALLLMLQAVNLFLLLSLFKICFFQLTL